MGDADLHSCGEQSRGESKSQDSASALGNFNKELTQAINITATSLRRTMGPS